MLVTRRLARRRVTLAFEAWLASASSASTVGFNLNNNEDHKTDAGEASGFSRRPTTEMQIPTELQESDPNPFAAHQTPTRPHQQPDLLLRSLEEQTETETRRSRTLNGMPGSEPLDADDTLQKIATIEGFCAGAILDTEWGELLASYKSDAVDVAFAAQIALSDLPTLHGRRPQEVATTTSTHYELFHVIEGPFVTLCCYTLWDRAHTNLAIAHTSLQPPLAQLAHRQQAA
jgi:hypothetical protein